jgi:hypothetical protein
MVVLPGLSLDSVVATVTSIRIWANQAEKTWHEMLEAHTFPAATYSSVVKDNHLEDKRLPVFSLAGVHSRSCSSTANFERDLHYSKNADTCAKLENSEEYRLSRVIPVLRVATVNVNGAQLLQKSQVSALLPVCTYIYVYVLHWAKLNKIE